MKLKNKYLSKKRIKQKLFGIYKYYNIQEPDLMDVCRVISDPSFPPLT
jgi:hypothetical protein